MIGLTVAAMVFGALCWLLMGDVGPPDEVPMRLEKVLQRNSEPNGLAEFLQIHKGEIQELKTRIADGALSFSLDDFEGNAHWERIGELVQAHQSLLHAFSDLAASGGRWQLLEVAPELSNLTPLHSLFDIYELTQSSYWEVRWLLHSNRTEEAKRRAQQFVVLADRLIQAEGPLVPMLMATGTMQQAHDCVVRLLLSPVASDRVTLRTFREVLMDTRLPSTAFAAALRVDYIGFRNAISRTKEGYRGILAQSDSEHLISFVKPNWDLHDSIQDRVALVDALDNGWVEASWETERLEQIWNDRRNSRAWRWHPNFVGRKLRIEFNDAVVMFMNRSLQVVADHRCLLLAIELRLAEVRNSRLPGDLDAIRDRLPPEVFTDPFLPSSDLVWLADDGLVYSVGKDRIDDGGLISSPIGSHSDGDTGLRYPWHPYTSEQDMR